MSDGIGPARGAGGAFCTQCGAPGSPADTFCRQCGKRRAAPAASPAVPSSLQFQRPPAPSAPGQPRELSAAAPGERDLLPASRTLQRAGGPPGALAAPPPARPSLTRCSSCSAPLPNGSNGCPACGASRALSPVGMCHRCGAGNPASDRYCRRCGSLLVTNALSSYNPAPSALPVFGSIILPGLGQMMNGDVMKGFVLLGAALWVIYGATVFHPVYLLITAIAAVDAAVSRSRRHNPGYTTRRWA